MRSWIFFVILSISDAGLAKTDVSAYKNISLKQPYFQAYQRSDFLKQELRADYAKTGEEILSSLLLISSSTPQPKTEYIDSKNQMLEEWTQRHKKIAGVDR